MTVYLLCDNGSVKPAATLRLRQLAQQLAEHSGKTIHPVSLMHANKIPADLINDEPAIIFPDFLDKQLASGLRDFCVLPLFFGLSRALTSYIPQKVQEAVGKHGPFSLTVEEVLYPLPQGEPEMIKIVIDHIKATASSHAMPLKNIVLVDHGSPSPRVTAVREHIATAIQETPGLDIKPEQAVMERREGKEYDFNGPLLENWLIEKAQQGESRVIITLIFLLPGKHAGAGGDIVEICQSVRDRFPGFKIAISPLISEHPALLNILSLRMAN